MGRPAVAVLALALGQHVFFLRPPASGTAGFPQDNGVSRVQALRIGTPAVRAMIKPSELVSKQNYQQRSCCQVDFETLLFSKEGKSCQGANGGTPAAGRPARASRGYDGELSPAQWMALRFFARANSFSRTPSAFAEFQATDPCNCITSIKALEAGGYWSDSDPRRMAGASPYD